MKTECPFCHKVFKGNAPDGESFYDKHEKTCGDREPPNPASLPIQACLTECQKCGNGEFRFIAHMDSWHPRRALWEYACTKCNQHHTTLSSNMKIADDVPYKTKGPTKKKPPKWER